MTNPMVKTRVAENRSPVDAHHAAQWNDVKLSDISGVAKLNVRTHIL